MADFQAVLQHHEIDEEALVTIDKMIELLTDMGFVNEAPQIKNQHVTEIWNHLRGNDNENGVKVWNIKVFLSAILNYSYDWMKPQNTSANETRQIENNNEGEQENQE